jgi:HlyD family secretion protein
MSKSSARLILALATLVALAIGAYWIDRAHLLARWIDRPEANSILLSGNIEAHASVLSFKGLQARVIELPFNEGQTVRQGETLAVVDSRELKQQIEIADAAVIVQQRQLDAALQNLAVALKTIEADQAAVAQRLLDLQRAQDLQKQGFVSNAALDSARTALIEQRALLARDQALEQLAARNIKVAQASLNSVRQTAALSRISDSNSTLNAPFDGVILNRQAEVGEVVAPGTPIVTIADLDHVWLRAYLNETDLSRVKLGQQVSISTDAEPGKKISGRLSFISSQAEFTPKSVETHAERVTLVYRVKIDIANPDHLFLPGMPADARLIPMSK